MHLIIKRGLSHLPLPSSPVSQKDRVVYPGLGRFLTFVNKEVLQVGG